MKRYRAFVPALPVALTISLLAAALSATPARRLIEQSMVWHMVIQMPMLVLGGWLVMRHIANKRVSHLLATWNRYGLTGFIGAQAIVAYWMLPLAIDRAVVLPQIDALKLVSLFTCGAMLRHSVERSPAVLQLFFVGYTVSMMTWLGIYFATTDLRLCNAYSLESQTSAGRGIMVLGIALGCVWAISAIWQVKGSWRQRHTEIQYGHHHPRAAAEAGRKAPQAALLDYRESRSQER